MPSKRAKTTTITKRYKDKQTGRVRQIDINYAKVADRLVEFRSDYPNSKIAVKNQFDENGNLFSHAYVWRDKADFLDLMKCGVSASEAMDSADAEGSSVMFANRLKFEKGHEINETIAVGRALALIGYTASGDIASSEEMEEFEEYKKEKAKEVQDEAIKSLSDAGSIDELRDVWLSLPKEQQLDKTVQAAKDARKEELANG